MVSFRPPTTTAPMIRSAHSSMTNIQKRVSFTKTLSKLAMHDTRSDPDSYTEAPPSPRVSMEMNWFLEWFNHTAPEGQHPLPALARAGIAHLYFESIHPFEDGNGRIGRAIAEKALSQGFGYPTILSLSHAIEAKKKNYYSALHSASKSNEITDWIKYFLSVVLDAQIETEAQINFIIKKAAYF